MVQEFTTIHRKKGTRLGREPIQMRIMIKNTLVDLEMNRNTNNYRTLADMPEIHRIGIMMGLRPKSLFMFNGLL